MKFLAKVFGVSLVWHLGKIIYDVSKEILFMRLHKNKHYNKITGGVLKRKSEVNSDTIGNIKAQRKIGF